MERPTGEQISKLVGQAVSLTTSNGGALAGLLQQGPPGAFIIQTPAGVSYQVEWWRIATID